MRPRTARLLALLPCLAALLPPVPARAQHAPPPAGPPVEMVDEFTNEPGATGDTAAPSTPPPPSVTHAQITCREAGLRREFPLAAYRANVDNAVVRVRVTVDARGRIRGAEPLNDPGLGFAAAAVRVVMRHCRARPARDPRGRAVADRVVFRVSFVVD